MKITLIQKDIAVKYRNTYNIEKVNVLNEYVNDMP